MRYLIPRFCLALLLLLGFSPGSAVAQTVTFYADTVTTLNPNTVDVIVPVRGENINSIATFATTLEFDPLYVTYQGVETNNVAGFGSLLINPIPSTNDRLAISFYVSGTIPLDANDGDVLFSLRFTLNASMLDETDLVFSSNPLAQSVGTIPGNNPAASFAFEPGKVIRDKLTIKGDTVTGPAGGQVVVPFRVWNFDDIVSFQGTIGFDETKLSYVGTEQYGPSYVGAGGFGTTNVGSGELSVSQFGSLPERLNDGEVLFAVRFNVLSSTLGEEIPVTYIDGVINPGASIEFVYQDPTNLTINYPVGVNSLQGMVEVGTAAPSDIALNARVYLEGPYQGGGDMNPALIAQPTFPLTDPYLGTETTTTGVLNTVGDEVVDWVLVELRDAVDPTIISGSRPALLQRDGDIVAADGSGLTFPGVSAGNYYVAIQHRNHLGVMTAATYAISATAIAVDFTNPGTATFGSQALKTVSGSPAMYAGDGDGNGIIQPTDLFSVWFVQSGQFGYLSGDFDLSGIVQPTDLFNYWIPNSGRFAQLP